MAVEIGKDRLELSRRIPRHLHLRGFGREYSRRRPGGTTVSSGRSRCRGGIEHGGSGIGGSQPGGFQGERTRGRTFAIRAIVLVAGVAGWAQSGHERDNCNTQGEQRVSLSRSLQNKSFCTVDHHHLPRERAMVMGQWQNRQLDFILGLPLPPPVFR